MEQTFILIKPNAVKKQKAGAIIKKFQQEGLTLVGLKMAHLSKDQCREFYQEHKERPFFQSLVDFVSSSPVIVMVLQGFGAVLKAREILGDTDPKKASPGTIRYEYGDSIEENAAHGSDSITSAKREKELFFSKKELFLNERAGG